MKFLVSTFFTRIRNPHECKDVCNIIPSLEPGSIDVSHSPGMSQRFQQRFHYGRRKVNTCIAGDYCIANDARVKNNMSNYADELLDYHRYVLLHLDQIKWEWK